MVGYFEVFMAGIFVGEEEFLGEELGPGERGCG